MDHDSWSKFQKAFQMFHLRFGERSSIEVFNLKTFNERLSLKACRFQSFSSYLVLFDEFRIIKILRQIVLMQRDESPDPLPIETIIHLDYFRSTFRSEFSMEMLIEKIINTVDSTEGGIRLLQIS